jgi:CheY-like chemotaxis protein
MKTNMSIFLAEDDEDDVSFFLEAISELFSDIRVTIACNGKMLMQQLKMSEVVPDAIFLDLNMPLKNGVDCLKEIKSNDAWKGIKTIILSTSSDDTQKQECYSLGADIFLTKPASIDKLTLYLKSCLL